MHSPRSLTLEFPRMPHYEGAMVKFFTMTDSCSYDILCGAKGGVQSLEVKKGTLAPQMFLTQHPGCRI